MKIKTKKSNVSLQLSFDGIEDEQSKLERLTVIKPKKDVYTNTAESLMQHKRNALKNLDKEQLKIESAKFDAIKIDHIAFAFPIAELRQCRKSGQMGKTFRTQTKYPTLPEFKTCHSTDLDELEKHKNETTEKLKDFYERTLKTWVNEVLGFEMSPMRGRGLHGYKDSMTLRAHGADVGFIGLGGQRDTIYFQISGTGCKSLFEHTNPFILHHWLSKVFTITKLSRIDLAFDDFDNNFNCDYAEQAHKDDWFRTSNRGMSPEVNPNHKYSYDKNMNKVFSQEMVCVGSRRSIIYWRIYDKKLEQGIKQDDFTWYRSEAELKKWSVDCLLNVAATFAGLCPFAGSINLEKGIRTKSMSKAKEVCLDIAARVRHVRRSAGKALGDILEILEGDIQQTIGLILPEDTGGKLGIPPTYKHLINHVIEV